jgi:transcriptional regulator with XRE-family HTH domain
MSLDLRTERMNRGVTIETLAAETGVSRATIIRLEQGATPQAPTAKRVAAFFDLKATDLWPVENPRAAA